MEERAKWNLLIVGGNDDVVRQIRKHLADNNIHIGAHWETSREVQSAIPKKCNGVIILKDFISHTLAEKAREVAAKDGIRCCITVRKWASMSLALAATGFISPKMMATPEPSKGRGRVVEKRLIQQFVKATTGVAISDSAAELLNEAVDSGDIEVTKAALMAIPGTRQVVLGQPAHKATTTQDTTQVTVQEEAQSMAKPNLSVSVQTVPTPASASRPTRAELIEILKNAALELITDHNVMDIKINEAEGIQIKVMEQLNVKL